MIGGGGELQLSIVSVSVRDKQTNEYKRYYAKSESGITMLLLSDHQLFTYFTMYVCVKIIVAIHLPLHKGSN